MLLSTVRKMRRKKILSEIIDYTQIWELGNSAYLEEYFLIRKQDGYYVEARVDGKVIVHKRIDVDEKRARQKFREFVETGKLVVY